MKPSTAPQPIELKHLYDISQIVSLAPEWHPALDQISRLVRSIFIFDNLAVYLVEDNQIEMNVVYARAVGRGRTNEAEASWGEDLATQAIDRRQTLMKEPPEKSGDRLKRPYILGIPLLVNLRCLGAIVFIRFGGPSFLPEQVQLAEFIAQQISLLIARQNLQREYDILENQHRQSKVQEDFISTISHELRSPLGFIKGYTTTLLRQDTQWDQATQKEFLNIIDRETDHLQELIGNLLDSARLQSGQMNMRFQAIHLDALMEDIVERARLHYPSLQIRLETPRVPVIYGDPRRLAQVMENLLGNAVKYAPGSLVLVQIGANERNAFIHVQDFGPGIPAQYVGRIFERFFRNPEQDASTHGSGLGLYICKQIVLAHRGQIMVDSQLGLGTTFTLELPLSTPQSHDTL